MPWDGVTGCVHRGCNADADESTLVYAHKKRTAKKLAMELMIVAMLPKTGDGEWTAEGLSPIRSIEVRDIMPSYSPLGAVITLSDGRQFQVDFVNVDGHRMC